jgi:RNA polymerase sigma factor (sigma-70 family)
MNAANAATVVRRLCGLTSAPGLVHTDAELLKRFLGGDQAAFEAIVRRHGRLVFGVCRHVLGHVEDAEDAFQATFLVLARRAASLRKPEALAAWLHGVARQTALRTRRDSNRRKARERQARAARAGHEPGETSLLELQALLDVEVQRLPEDYRTVFVLCVLESRSTNEAAAQLGWKPGTVSGRLTRAKQMLVHRLARRGVTLSAALTAAGLECQSARAAVPPTLTVAASRFASAVRGVAEVEPASRVLELAGGVGRSAALARSGVVLAIALTTAVAGIGAAYWQPFEPRAAEVRAVDGPADAAPQLPQPESASADAGWLKNINRTIRKEPVYASKSPRYALLVFGPRAADRVWLVHDGATLYVDRKANGDLTDPADKVAGEVLANGPIRDAYHRFKLDELRVGGRVHKGFDVYASLLSQSSNSVETQANAKAAAAADPGARAYSVLLEVDWPGLRGKGTGGRVFQQAGPLDGNGALLFGTSPADAPIIHFGGPLQITFEGKRPTLKLGWDNTAILVVGTPGVGEGTLSLVYYDGVIPESAAPVVDIVFPAAHQGEPAITRRYEMKERCCRVDLYGPVRPPDTAGPGVARVTLSLASWTGMNVAPTSHVTAVAARKAEAETTSARLVRSLLHPDRTARMPVVRFSSDGTRLFTGGYSQAGSGCALQVWEVLSGKEIACAQLPGAAATVQFGSVAADLSVAFTPQSGWKLVQGDDENNAKPRVTFDGAVRVHDLVTGQPKSPIPAVPGHAVTRVFAAPDGKTLLTFQQAPSAPTEAGEISAVLVDVTKATTRTLATDPRDAAFAPNSKQLVLTNHIGATGNSELKLLDTSGNVLAVLASEKGAALLRPQFSPDGRLVVVEELRRSAKAAESGRGTLRIWELATRKELKSLDAGGEFGFNRCAFSPDSRLLAATDIRGHIHVWTIASGTSVLEYTVPAKLLGGWVAFAPDGRHLAVSSPPRLSADEYANYPDPQDLVQPRVYLFDLTKPVAEPEVLIAPPGLAGGLAWSPDGKTLALGGSGAVHLFDVARLK